MLLLLMWTFVRTLGRVVYNVFCCCFAGDLSTMLVCGLNGRKLFFTMSFLTTHTN